MSKYSPTQAQQIKEIGQYLYQKRLQHSLSLEQLSSLTFIRLFMLKALEEGQIEQLPELVYVQGFIRRYGEVVHIDGHALAQQITSSTEEKPDISPDLVSSPVVEESLGQDAPPQATNQDQKMPKSSVAVASKARIAPDVSQERENAPENRLLKKFKLYWVYLLVLGGAIGGLFYLFGRPPATETTVNNRPAQTVKPAQTPFKEQPKPATQSETVTQPDKLISSQTPSPLLETPPESTTSEPVRESAATRETSETTQTAPESEVAADTSPQTDGVEAAIKLENDSWLRVKVDGKTEYEGILEKGTQQTWTANENVVIRAGNAGAVNLSVNNQPSQKLGELGEVKEITITPDG